jgi:hypothetical protein
MKRRSQVENGVEKPVPKAYAFLLKLASQENKYS